MMVSPSLGTRLGITHTVILVADESPRGKHKPSSPPELPTDGPLIHVATEALVCAMFEHLGRWTKNQWPCHPSTQQRHTCTPCGSCLCSSSLTNSVMTSLSPVSTSSLPACSPSPSPVGRMMEGLILVEWDTLIDFRTHDGSRCSKEGSFNTAKMEPGGGYDVSNNCAGGTDPQWGLISLPGNANLACCSVVSFPDPHPGFGNETRCSGVQHYKTAATSTHSLSLGHSTVLRTVSLCWRSAYGPCPLQQPFVAPVMVVMIV